MPKKLLIVTTIATTLKAFLLPYARHFREKGWQVDALARDASCLEDLAEARQGFGRFYDVPFSRRPWELRGVRATEKSIRELILHKGYDIVHTHTPVASFVTRHALSALPRSLRPAVVYTAHGFHFFKGGHPLKNFLYRSLERRAGRWTDHLIVINQEDYQAALRHKLIPPESLSLLPGVGLDLLSYSADNFNTEDVRKIRCELGLKPGEFLFLMVAEFNSGKRHKDALSALALTRRKDFHLALAGDGPLKESVRQQAETLNIVSQVQFLGHRSDVPLLMLASCATVLPSEREGLNRSVMESLSLGVPVLGADSRGIRELLTSPERGRLFPTGDAKSLSDAMIAAAEAPSPVRPKPDPQWDIRHLLAEHERIYQSLRKRA
ncbi:MAG: glycosyltransferase family 4 protein [Fretibacterium sp.]|nr:glycosyltransferase family 4 protein [Fretibacterium sp.]